ncbi:MAG: hypothetical protein ABIG11_03250 [bacterium]
MDKRKSAAGASIGTFKYPYFGYGGYPPFSLLKYRINEEKNPRYFITVSGRKTPPLSEDPGERYKPVAEFRRPFEFLEIFFDSSLLRRMGGRVTVYELSKNLLNKSRTM